jgi:hypothetical protein
MAIRGAQACRSICSPNCLRVPNFHFDPDELPADRPSLARDGKFDFAPNLAIESLTGSYSP